MSWLGVGTRVTSWQSSRAAARFSLQSFDHLNIIFIGPCAMCKPYARSLYLDGVMPWGGASRRGGDNTSCVVTHVFSPPLLRAPSPLRPGTIRAAPSLSSSSTPSPRHAGIAGLSNIGQAPCTRPSGPSEDKLFGLNQQVDRTATMNPVLICLLVMVTFFFLLCDAARTGLAQGRAISPSP